MKLAWVRFIFSLIIFALALLSVNYFLLEVVFERPFTWLHYVVHGYYLFLVIAAQLILDNALKDRPQRFVIAFMAVMGGKMFLSLGLLFIIAYGGIANSKYFIVNYLILYLLYAVFSVRQVLIFQKKAISLSQGSKPHSQDGTVTD